MSSPRPLVPLLCLILVSALTARPVVAQEPPGRGDSLPQWSVAYGGFGELDDIAPLGANRAWAVNALQTLAGAPQSVFVRQEGGVWRVTQVVDGITLTAMAFAGPDTGFAVGAAGQLWRWNGASWGRQVVPTGEDLGDVTVVGPTAAWVAGDTGVILGWDGRDWVRQTLPSDLKFSPVTSVAAVEPTEAWATVLGGAVLHYDGSWKVAPTPAITRPVQIALNGPARALVAGRGALEWSGGTWRRIGDANTSYRSVAWVGEDAYFVANDRLVLYRAGAWSPVTLQEGPGDLAAKRFERLVAAGDGAWAIASDGSLAWLTAGSARYVWPPIRALRGLDLVPGLLWTGGDTITAGFVGFREDALISQVGPTRGTVWDLDLASGQDGWAVSEERGVAGTTALWRWDGSRWNQHTADKTWLLSRVQALAGDEAWAGGGNAVARWRGAAWELVPDTPLGADGPLSVLRGGDAPAAWFGSFGRILHLVAGTWSEQLVADTRGFVALEVVAEDAGWAATPQTLFRYDGRAWTPVEHPKPRLAVFRDLDATAPDDVWLLLDPPALLHWAAGRWEYHDLVPLGGDARPRRLRVVTNPPAPARTDVWMVGDPPTIARYRIQTPETQLYLPVARKSD